VEQQPGAGRAGAADHCRHAHSQEDRRQLKLHLNFADITAEVIAGR
jgi:hypothetical protein